MAGVAGTKRLFVSLLCDNDLLKGSLLLHAEDNLCSVKLTSFAGGANVWQITPEERAKHDQQFMSLKPVGGMVTGMFSSFI